MVLRGSISAEEVSVGHAELEQSRSEKSDQGQVSLMCGVKVPSVSRHSLGRIVSSVNEPKRSERSRKKRWPCGTTPVVQCQHALQLQHSNKTCRSGVHGDQ